jgi:drug/metabolite transporter (DMT)-like permease
MVDGARDTTSLIPDARRQPQWTVWAAFAGLCVLLSSAWLLPAESMDMPSPMEQQSCFYGIVGLISAMFAYRGLRARWREQEWLWLHLAGVSVLLLGLPSVLGDWVSQGMSDITRAAFFGLVPFVVVVVAMGRDLEPGVRRFFAPALAGFGGVLLLLPFGFPTSVRGQWTLGVLLMAIVMVGVASEWIYRLIRGFEMMEALAIVCLANAVFLAACHFAGLPFSGSWSVASSLISIHSLYRLMELLLLVWLLREMSPVRLAARYLVVPLFTVLEGFAFLRPGLTVRMGVGLGLLVGGAGYLLLSRGWDSDAVLSIR